jgi:hypothetical protein
MGDLSEKPGWVRMSLHPTMSNQEVDYLIDAVRQVADNAELWSDDYRYERRLNDYVHVSVPRKIPEDYMSWFEF